MNAIGKLRNATLGLALGICTMPLGVVAWPLFLAWWCWNETDDEGSGT